MAQHPGRHIPKLSAPVRNKVPQIQPKKTSLSSGIAKSGFIGKSRQARTALRGTRQNANARDFGRATAAFGGGNRASSGGATRNAGRLASLAGRSSRSTSPNALRRHTRPEDVKKARPNPLRKPQ